jgi:hypothetical protein
VPRSRILIVVLVAALVATASVPASTIVGTARNDTLEGTQRADKLDGKAGNDTLFGLRGNDVLLGGPGNDRLLGGRGADRLVCGRGRDSAVADAKDRVARDCEIVNGRRLPPAAPPVAVGTYCGSTTQGMPVCFDVGSKGAATDRIIASASLAVQAECVPTRQTERSFIVRSFFNAVNRDRTFTAHAVISGYASTFKGTFSQSGTSARGSLSVQFVEEHDRVRYECDSGSVSWSARTPPPVASAQPGTFCGLTEQQLEYCFDVADTPATVRNLKLLIRVECSPAATFAVSSTIPTRYAIRDDRGFSIRRRGSGTSGGGSFTVEHAIDGAFDAAGVSASGVLTAHVSYDASDGTHYDCDSGSFGWSTQRR